MIESQSLDEYVVEKSEIHRPVFKKPRRRRKKFFGGAQKSHIRLYLSFVNFSYPFHLQHSAWCVDPVPIINQKTRE